MHVRSVLFAAALCLCFSAFVMAQDPTKVDSKHYTVVSENDKVRILRIHYGPHEKSVMHYHPDAVAVFLTDVNGQFTLPDGTKQPMNVKAGDTRFTPAGQHMPENLGDAPFELVLVELKGHAAKAAKPAKTTKPAEKKKD